MNNNLIEMSADQAASKLTSTRSNREAAAAAAEAEAEAKKTAEREEKVAIASAIVTQKYFKRKREGTDSIGDKSEYSQFIRVDGLVEGKLTLFNTKGIDTTRGVVVDVYTADTLVGLDLSSGTEFADAKSAYESVKCKPCLH